MNWSITSIIGIGLRLFSNRAEVERLIRKSIELWNEWLALLRNVAPQVLDATAVDVSVLKDARGVEHEYDVKWVQMALNHLLHPRVTLDVDGDMGDATREAIELYQGEKGLNVDGWLGPQTMAALDADVRAAHAR